ncbi:hypothetical protein QA601_08025 [Chitinispirillales bacterium ANBcel5]|uniref:hypothetical protein n=1 Tax=Cellulosispirillum alkaliphilum TaxID=3039283 RepID=UPI002A4E8C37|nr:hypothetical protein [Chitinispirillales bacterium ANBcel5]
MVLATGSFASRSAGRTDAYIRPAAGAAAMGFGGAYSVAPDYLISWYNPAHLASLRQTRASLGGGFRSLGRREGAASLQFRVPPRLGAGISVLYRGDPSIRGLYDGYYEGGTVVREEALERTAFTSITTKFAVGYNFSRALKLGASIGVFYQSLPTTPNDDGEVLNSSVTTIGGFDFAAQYTVTEPWIIALQLKNLGGRVKWHFEDVDWSRPPREEKIVPSFVLASHLTSELAERVFIWNLDLVNYFPDTDGDDLISPEMVIHTGAEWQYSSNFYIRAGIGDIEINSDIYRNSSEFFRAFSPRFSAGFSWDMVNVMEGVRLNYAIATDRIWAGVDQAMDITFIF